MREIVIVRPDETGKKQHLEQVVSEVMTPAFLQIADKGVEPLNLGQKDRTSSKKLSISSIVRHMMLTKSF